MRYFNIFTNLSGDGKIDINGNYEFFIKINFFLNFLTMVKLSFAFLLFALGICRVLQSSERIR